VGMEANHAVLCNNQANPTRYLLRETGGGPDNIPLTERQDPVSHLLAA
jgi:hypothetical protein